MTNWVRPFGAWAPADPSDEDSIIAAHVIAGARLDLELFDAGAEALGPVRFRSAQSRPIFGDPELDGPQLAVVADVRGIVLRHPNPFPKIRLFARAKAAT